MATNIGPKIGIEGEAQYRKQMQQIISQAKTLDTQYKAVTATFNKYTSAEEKATKKSGVLKQQIAQQNQALKGLQQGLAAAAQKFGVNDERTQKWARSVNEAQARLNRMNAELKELRTEQLQKLAQGAKTAGSAVVKVAESVAKIGAAIGTALIGIAAASAKFMKDAIQTGMEFDTAMANVAATMGKTVDQVQDLREFALRMGSQTVFSAKEAAEALNYMALAGYNANTAMQMLPVVLDLAAAGEIDLASASDMVTDAQSALGLSMDGARRMVDKMAQASSKSNTSVQQLGEAILTVGGTAKSLRGGMDELTTILGLLADNGIKGAEGGTALRNILLALTAPTTKAQKALKNIGVTAFDDAGNMRELSDVFIDLQKALDGLSDDKRAEILSDIFNKRDIASANALLGTSVNRWEELSDAIQSSQGAANKMSKTKLDNLAGDVTLFKSALEGAKIALSTGVNPQLRQLVQFGTKGVQRLTDAFDKGGLNGALEEFGNLLDEALNMGFEGLPDFVEVATGIMGKVNEAIQKNPDKIKEAAQTLIKNLIAGIHENAYSTTYNATDIIGALVADLTSEESLSDLLDTGWDIVRGIANGVSDHADDILMAIPNLLQTIADDLRDADKRQEMIETASNFMRSFGIACANSANVLAEVIPDIVSAVAEVMSDPEVIEAFALAGSEASAAMFVGIATGIIENFPEYLGRAFGSIPANIIKERINNGMKQGAEDAGKQTDEDIAGGMTANLDPIDSASKDVEKAINAPLTSATADQDYKRSGQHVIDTLSKAIEDRISRLRTAASAAADAVRRFLHFSRPDEGPLRDYEAWMPDMMDGLAKGMRDNAWRLREAASSVGLGIASGFTPGRSYVNNVGGISVNVYGAEGQSVDALADKVMDRINISLQDSGRVWA